MFDNKKANITQSL